MSDQAMRMFLSEENIKRHKEFVNSLRLKRSILEKSDSKAMRIDGRLKREAEYLDWQIKSHELFLGSFSSAVKRSAKGESIRYKLYLECMDHENGFLYIYFDRGLRTKSVADNWSIPNKEKCLCLDLYEHCYFLDYGFKKDKFLKNMLPYLDIERLLDN